MLRNTLLIAITGFWLVMTSQLIQKEFFEISTFETSSQWVPITTTALREDYKAIYLGKERIGFEYVGMQKHDSKKEGKFELGHNSFMSFSLLGKPNEMFVKDRSWLNEDLSLKSFKLIVRTKDYSTEMEGKVAGNQIEVVIKEKNSEPTFKKIQIEEPVLYSESLEQLWTPNNLRIGKEKRFKVFNPLTLGIEELLFRVERKETIEQHHKKQDAFLILANNGTYETKSWVNPDGITLRKETANGLILDREPAWETFDALRAKMHTPIDLPSFYSVASNKILEKSFELEKLSVKVETPKKTNTFYIQKQSLKGLETLRISDIKKEDVPEFIKGSEMIQSEDPVIQKQAQEIIAGTSSALEASTKIMNWVHQNMTPTPTASIPSAIQVLKIKKGDCNEYTALFTALARSAGIPTQMIAGLVYQNGRFYYHAWASIYLNQWINIDPTFNQFPVDATHIPLVIGNLKEQVNLANQIGRIKITVIDSSPEVNHASHD